MFPPGFEPGAFRVLGERDNHYTTETFESCIQACDERKVAFVINHTLLILEQHHLPVDVPKTVLPKSSLV